MPPAASSPLSSPPPRFIFRCLGAQPPCPPQYATCLLEALSTYHHKETVYGVYRCMCMAPLITSKQLAQGTLSPPLSSCLAGTVHSASWDYMQLPVETQNPSHTRDMCQLVLLAVPTVLGFQEEMVYIACPQTAGERFFRESGTVGPVLTSAASAPWRPLYAGAGNASHSVISMTVKFGRCSPPQMIEKVTQGQAFPNNQMLHISGVQHFQAFCLVWEKQGWVGTKQERCEP